MTNLKQEEHEMTPRSTGVMLLNSFDDLSHCHAPFVKNYNRLVIENLFCASLIIPYENISRHEAKKLACSIVQAVYSVFKAQIFLSHAFRENKGQLSQE